MSEPSLHPPTRDDSAFRPYRSNPNTPLHPRESTYVPPSPSEGYDPLMTSEVLSDMPARHQDPSYPSITHPNTLQNPQGVDITNRGILSDVGTLACHVAVNGAQAVGQHMLAQANLGTFTNMATNQMINQAAQYLRQSCNPAPNSNPNPNTLPNPNPSLDVSTNHIHNHASSPNPNPNPNSYQSPYSDRHAHFQHLKNKQQALLQHWEEDVVSTVNNQLAQALLENQDLTIKNRHLNHDIQEILHEFQTMEQANQQMQDQLKSLQQKLEAKSRQNSPRPVEYLGSPSHSTIDGKPTMVQSLCNMAKGLTELLPKASPKDTSKSPPKVIGGVELQTISASKSTTLPNFKPQSHKVQPTPKPIGGAITHPVLTKSHPAKQEHPSAPPLIDINTSAPASYPPLDYPKAMPHQHHNYDVSLLSRQPTKQHEAHLNHPTPNLCTKLEESERLLNHHQQSSGPIDIKPPIKTGHSRVSHPHQTPPHQTLPSFNYQPQHHYSTPPHQVIHPYTPPHPSFELSTPQSSTTTPQPTSSELSTTTTNFPTTIPTSSPTTPISLPT
jgi:hypothetical protein